jgi:hypothetical protein
VLAATLVLVLVSCRGNDPNAPVPVRGRVLYRGRPAEGARVTFVPTDASDPAAPRPTAAIEKDGTFRLTTKLSYDGAPPGRYAVTIVYPSPAKKVDDENAGPDLLGGKYASPKTTPLHVEVKPIANELEPFLLK